MKKILEKVARFVELSKEFSIKESDMYEGFEVPINYTYSLMASGNAKTSVSSLNSPETQGKQEAYYNFLNDKMELVKRWEEYKSLQEDLNNYFKSVDKLMSEDVNVDGRV